MLLRMFVHSAVFTLAIAFGAVALNGAGMLDQHEPGKTRNYSSGYAGDNAFWLKEDEHGDWKHREHDDD